MLLPLAVGCRNAGDRAPGPTAYQWPDSFAYKIEYVSDSRADTTLVARYEERKELDFAVRDERFLVWHDSVVKESFAPGRPAQEEPYAPEDTLHYYVTLNRRGQVAHSEPACDPALEGCRQVLPSALPLELQRLIPRLPLWEAPRGSGWADTLVFDDTPRARGARGSVVTAYRVLGDTVVGGTPLWKVGWRSVRRSFTLPRGLGGIVADVPVEESGFAFIDKARALPVFAMWGGAVLAPPALRAMGVSTTAFRGRAYLAGSVVEQLLGPPQ